MKQYNRSLDHTTLALAYGRKAKKATLAGNAEEAAKYMLKAASEFDRAISAPDILRGVAVLETSNAMAWEAREAAKASTKPTPKTKTQAAEEEFDMGEEEEEPDGEEEEESEGEEVEGATEEDEDSEDDFDATFARVLASLVKPKVKAAAKPAPKAKK